MMKHKLPKNWIVLNSKTHPDRIYYFNVKTNQSSWEKPTVDHAEKVTRKSRKRKKSSEKDELSPVEPTSPKYNVPEKEIAERKKLVARRTIGQKQEKVKEEKETPQMKAIREKISKKKEKNISKNCGPKISKDVTVSTSLKLDSANALTSKSDTSTSSKTACTPQMRVLLEKMQEKTLKRSSKLKKSGQGGDSKTYKEALPIRTRFKNQGGSDKKNLLELSQHLLNENKEKEERSKEVDIIESNATKRRRVRPAKQNRKSMKKNLGKMRMEKLRESLASEYKNAESLDDSKRETLPNIYKNAEVRLTRLKDKLSNDKISVNKDSVTDAPEEIANSSQESITTVTDLVNRTNENSFYEDMDWEPMEDEKITFEVQAVRTQLCTENSANRSWKVPTNTLECPISSVHQEKKQLYIVVDTNVFLSNIQAIDLARETIFKTYDRPFIVIPWTVIRELDYIKDNNARTKSASLCGKARKAVNYINKLFSSKQPRIIGQTPENVAKNKEKFSAECPDDEILQTCLQILDLGKSVVLLSYDVNLCNKAMIYDIVTLGRNDPFEKVDYLNATNYINDTVSCSNSGNRGSLSLESPVNINQEQFFADEIFEDTKSILRDFLTVVVSKEMYILYGESWEKYVIIKPPWTTVTVLQCVIKHWMAAVSESFRRKAIFILKELLQIFRNVSGKRSLRENSYILDKCSDLMQMVVEDKHRDLVSRVSKKIDELKQRCHKYEAQVLEQKLRDVIGYEGNIEEQEQRAQKAFQYFEAAYVFARDMCALAAEAVGMPCNFHYNIPNPLPSLDYVKQIQPELAANVNKLLSSLSAVIEQVKNSSTDYRTLINLHQTLITFLPDDVPAALKLVDVDLVPLDIYCCIKRKEEVLTRGLRQLQELSSHFCRLASYRCT